MSLQPYSVPSMGEIERIPHNGFCSVSTFSGAGGSSLGFRMAGFRVLWANEFIPEAQQVYSLKAQNGYSPYEIERKKLSLEGVLVPVTAKWNEELLHNAGFSQVDCFWRWMNFAGWIAIKE